MASIEQLGAFAASLTGPRALPRILSILDTGPMIDSSDRYSYSYWTIDTDVAKEFLGTIPKGALKDVSFDLIAFDGPMPAHRHRKSSAVMVPLFFDGSDPSAWEAVLGITFAGVQPTRLRTGGSIFIPADSVHGFNRLDGDAPLYALSVTHGYEDDDIEFAP